LCSSLYDFIHFLRLLHYNLFRGRQLLFLSFLLSSLLSVSVTSFAMRLLLVSNPNRNLDPELDDLGRGHGLGRGRGHGLGGLGLGHGRGLGRGHGRSLGLT
jgi:hypothetical protein